MPSLGCPLCLWLCAGALLVSGVGSGVACGARSGLDGSSSEQSAVFPWEPRGEYAPVRTPPECVQDWRTLYQAPGSPPAAIAVSAGEVLFGSWAGYGTASDITPPSSISSSTPQIVALDIASPSSSPRVIHSGLWYDDLWLEGDQLLAWSQGRLVRIPIAGGGDELVVDARGSDPSTSVYGMLVEQDAFYWVRPRTGSADLEIWQQQRPSGSPRRITSLDRGVVDVQLLAATSELVIVAGGTSSVAVPIEGGDFQPLDNVEDGELAGVDGLGAYYIRASNRTRRGGRALEFELRRSPADGSAATRFWHRRAGRRLDRIWRADAGWLATGAYYMFDGTPHSVIAHIDEDGSEVLIACDRGRNFVQGRPVFWQGAFYALTTSGNDWRIVEIRLPE